MLEVVPPDHNREIHMPRKLTKALSNKVTIRIWNVNMLIGHVSLQTHTGGRENKGIYASFWPKRSSPTVPSVAPSTLPQEAPSVEGYLSAALDEDIYSNEKRGPDFEIDLYSLNVSAINKAYALFERELQKGSVSWSLLGSSVAVILNSEKDISNCCALVTYLLSMGGIERSVEFIFPQDVANIVQLFSSVQRFFVSDAHTDAIMQEVRILAGYFLVCKSLSDGLKSNPNLIAEWAEAGRVKGTRWGGWGSRGGREARARAPAGGRPQ